MTWKQPRQHMETNQGMESQMNHHNGMQQEPGKLNTAKMEIPCEEHRSELRQTDEYYL